MQDGRILKISVDRFTCRCLSEYCCTVVARKGENAVLQRDGACFGPVIYPVKSCKGIRVDDVKCFREGMEFDRIFGMEGEGQYVGDEAAEWFSNYMGKPGFKVYQLSRPRVIREHDEWSDIGEAGDKASFGDFAPYMILAEASLAALNTQLPSPMEMERFRPNVVVNGLMAFEEVSLRRLRLVGPAGVALSKQRG
ncbi:Mitochondrial amidoxime reducing component 2 [Desmophyllum pertusum]|uniref:Mitochondrial amidoxime reducing component 2 n=1 Tax=Desmophyllum pertusum TaxID=174260 RepID=A0A9W9YVS1_9CNID|nr:Mitochondrial amidoxime reducing component 2 [Desmophyllum pertusum]